MSATTFELIFGALAKPIAEQLTGQGLKFDAKAVAAIQSDADACSRLCVRGYLTEAQRHSVRKKLLSRTRDALKGDR